ncbi:MAG: hypothetical protein ACLP36_00930 [Acidimicrobiales bacterium]
MFPVFILSLGQELAEATAAVKPTFDRAVYAGRSPLEREILAWSPLSSPLVGTEGLEPSL